MYEAELRAFNQTGVRYVIVGAIALALHRYPRATLDLDLLVALDAGNLRLAAEALTALGYKPRLPVAIEDLFDEATRARWVQERNMIAFSFIMDGGLPRCVDLLIASPLSFEQCAAHATLLSTGDLNVPVAALGDLLAMKKAAGRGKDAPDIEVLERMIAQRTAEEDQHAG